MRRKHVGSRQHGGSQQVRVIFCVFAAAASSHLQGVGIIQGRPAGRTLRRHFIPGYVNIS